MISPPLQIATSLFVLTAMTASWILEPSTTEPPQAEEMTKRAPAEDSTPRPRKKWSKFWKLWVHCLVCSENPCTYRIDRRLRSRNPSPTPPESSGPSISRR